MHSETKHDHQKPAVILQSRLSVDPGETRFITIPEAVELDFNSFIPQADITSQVHFFSNIRAESKAHSAGLTDGDRILQVNGVNVTHLEHEDVRRLLQLVTPLVLTVAHDPKYLAVLQQPVEHAEEKAPGNLDLEIKCNKASLFHVQNCPYDRHNTLCRMEFIPINPVT